MRAIRGECEAGDERVGDRLATIVTGRLASWVGVGVWLAVALVAFPFAVRLDSVESSRLSDLLPAGASSTEVARLDQAFPMGRDQQADVVFYRSSGLGSAELALARSKLDEAVAVLGRAIDRPSPLVEAPDRMAAVATVGVRGDQAQVQRTVKRLRSALGEQAGGMEVRVTGEAAISADLFGSLSGADLLLLAVTVSLVAALLAATYRSPVLWMVPLVTVGIAEVVARAVMYGLATAGFTVDVQSASLVTVIVFGAGTDYALLLTARYREELRAEADHRRAMRKAWRRAAPVVATSAATVVGALLCLLLARMRLVSGFGLVGVVGVVSAATVVLGAFPALLLVLGRGVFWPQVPRVTPGWTHRGAWAFLAKKVSKGNRPIWVSVLLLLGGAAVGLVTVDTSVTALGELPRDAPSVEGYALLARSFPPGEVSPVQVVVTDPAALSQLRRALGAIPVVAAVGPVQSSGSLSRFELILRVNPDSPRGLAAVEQVRSVAATTGGSGVLVGGPTAETLDVSSASHRDIYVIVPAVLAVVMAVLVLVLRALLGPLLVVVVMIVAFGAALGVTSAVFVPLLHLPGTDPTVPLLVFVFLMALGADYSVFLLSRMREEVVARGASEGVRRAVESTGGVLTSAGVVLAGTFVALAVLPVVASREIGVAVAIGVVADTFVVRTVLLPVLAADLGRWFWWPTRVVPVTSGAAGRGKD